MMTSGEGTMGSALGTGRRVLSEAVPVGYRRTEVGVIPSEWQVVTLGQLASVFRGASPRPIDSPVWFDSQSKVGWLRISDVTTSDRFLDDTAQNLSADGIANSRFVKSGNLVMSICATVGRPIITRKDVCIHDGFVVFHNLQADKEYLYYCLSNMETGWSKHGQTGSQMNLNTDLIDSISIPLPPPTEQRAIAEALSDVDELIGALERLIAKKRAIKQAAMQELLTGKTRLPGFKPTGTGGYVHRKGVSSGCRQTEVGLIPEDWRVIGLGEICKVRTGKRDVNEGNPEGQYPFFTCSREHTYSDSYSFDTEAILIAGNGEVGNLHYFRGKFEAYQRTYVLSDFRIDVQFFWYQLDAYLEKSLGIGTVGSSIPYIKKESLSGFRFGLPFSPAEQCAIAAVLSDMDAEIAALERRRDKTQAIKQGMMQQLLTGRVRLVESEPDGQTKVCPTAPLGWP